MWLLIAEAFIALGMFIFIVWWTMSSRRRNDSAPPALPPQVKAETSKEPSDGS